MNSDDIDRTVLSVLKEEVGKGTTKLTEEVNAHLKACALDSEDLQVLSDNRIRNVLFRLLAQQWVRGEKQKKFGTNSKPRKGRVVWFRTSAGSRALAGSS